MRHEPHNDEAQRVFPFESIRRIHPDGYEYWSARDLARVLGYKQYNKFVRVIEKAQVACENSGYMVENHFTHTSEMVEIGSGAKREFDTAFLFPHQGASFQQARIRERQRIESECQPSLFPDAENAGEPEQ